MTQPPPPPGWYDDPAGGGGLRWWDGGSWTPGVRQRSVLLEQPVLVVRQRTKLVELTNEYVVLDGAGQQVGAVAQVGQSGLRKAFRALSRWDQFLTHTLEVRDPAGPVLLLTRPAKLLRSRVLVARPDGTPV
ncbi:DUF2510 domain-containing protein, partial [Modestobacter roseus]